VARHNDSPTALEDSLMRVNLGHSPIAATVQNEPMESAESGRGILVPRGNGHQIVFPRSLVYEVFGTPARAPMSQFG
jgi:hypothetical protein